jgi:hypothetical protein
VATKPASPSLQGGNSLATGLARYWLLGEGSGTNVTDYSTNAATGTLNGGASWTTDASGNAVSCSGGGNLQLPFPAVTSGQDLSLLVIATPVTWPTTFNPLLDDSGRLWSLFFDTGGNVNFIAGTSVFSHPGNPATGLTTGSLWQLLQVRDVGVSNQIITYVNGSSVTTNGNSGGSASAATVHFGDNPSGGGANQNVVYNLVALWTRVLTGTEIAALATDPYAVVRPAGGGTPVGADAMQHYLAHVARAGVAA